MTILYEALVDAAKGLRLTNQKYIEMLNSDRLSDVQIARYQMLIKQNIKDVRFYLDLAKAEKDGKLTDRHD